MSFNHGYFFPKNIKKYIGNINKIYYRSGWEYNFMTICDLSDKILNWSFEPFKIRYYNFITRKFCNYYIDFWIRFLNENGEIEEAIIEIKPEYQTKKPKKKNNNKKSESEALYLINLMKWNAAKMFAERNNMKFYILTEKTLNFLNYEKSKNF